MEFKKIRGFVVSSIFVEVIYNGFGLLLGGFCNKY